MSNSQKYINVISILDIIFGVIGLIVGGLGAAGGLAIAGGAVQAEVGAADAAGFSIVMILVIIASIFSIVTGVLGVRAAKDASKIQPVFILAIVSLAIAVISLVLGYVQGKPDSSSVSSIIGSALMVWCANNVKKQNQG